MKISLRNRRPSWRHPLARLRWYFQPDQVREVVDVRDRKIILDRALDPPVGNGEMFIIDASPERRNGD
jgi:hypothetical protein